jgi:transglutaminase-like putative cysteine protease
MGLVLVRQTADEALNQGWATDTALDLVGQAAVPVTRPVDGARQRTTLRVRLSGIAVNDIPSDEEQVRHGAVLSISRPDAGSVGSYVLPYQGQEHAADLAPTAFLQSDHPRVQAVAREALGGERDAKRAAVRLNDWVYEHLRKVPTISIPNALQVLEMGEGDCNEHAVLLAALGRAVGLPTRVVAGTVYLDGAFFYHAWCEVWLGQWVSIDPAFDQFPADATHIKLIAGDPDEQVRMLGIIGRLGIEVLDDQGDSAG